METCRSHDESSVTLLLATPDEDLVAEARSGDRSAFTELWKRHSRTTFTRVYRITKNRADAEDVIQEVWLNAFVHLNTFDGRAKFSTWLTRIAINSALMTLRKKRSHPEAAMEYRDGETWRSREFADHTKDIERHYVKRESVERLRLAIRQLRPHLRTVIEIQQAKDGQVKEVADLAGISLSAAKSRLLRARTILRRALD
jgi:RNA polymerase sigma-70 factor (ECF subfamily)